MNSSEDTLNYLRSLADDSAENEIDTQYLITIFVALISSKSIDEIEANLERYITLAFRIYTMLFSK